MRRPTPEETQSAYQQAYIAQVIGSDVIATLKAQLVDTTHLLRHLTEEQSLYAYGPDKWSIKEVLGHLCDSERVFAYRALCIARGEQVPLPGYEQDDYVAIANFNARPFASILDEFTALRQCNISLFNSFDEDTLSRTGVANGNKVSVRALLFIIAGHEAHHINILRERYVQ